MARDEVVAMVRGVTARGDCARPFELHWLSCWAAGDGDAGGAGAAGCFWACHGVWRCVVKDAVCEKIRGRAVDAVIWIAEDDEGRRVMGREAVCEMLEGVGRAVRVMWIVSVLRGLRAVG